MPEFRIDLEWEDFPSARTPELSATWARLAIFADGVPVTKVEDHRSRGVRDANFCNDLSALWTYTRLQPAKFQSR